MSEIDDKSYMINEWNYERNKPLLPSDLAPRSNRKVWWKCKKGHEWQATLNDRYRGTGCPYCAGNRLIEGINDLQTVNPELSLEWNYEQNNPLRPSDFTGKSRKKVWWKCKNGHEWQANISDRARGNGCPYCAGKRPIIGVNDLETVNPKLALEWNYEKNKPKVPSDYMPRSGKKVWWKCKQGHEWQATIDSRNKNGCPYCAGQRVIQGENDLVTVAPEFAKEWNYERNKNLLPTEICAKSGKKVWWKCSKGHSYQCAIHHKTGENVTGCPYCSNQKVLEGYNDLATIYPELVAQWNYKKNVLLPKDYTSKSYKKVWWICAHGHEWEAGINKRVRGDNCPYCGGKKVAIGYNDLATTDPVIASEWNYKLNGELTPEKVTRGSNKKVWWVCNEGHEWIQAVNQRTRRGGNICPICRGIK